jgi:hypothetical protein
MSSHPPFEDLQEPDGTLPEIGRPILTYDRAIRTQTEKAIVFKITSDRNFPFTSCTVIQVEDVTNRRAVQLGDVVYFQKAYSSSPRRPELGLPGARLSGYSAGPQEAWTNSYDYTWSFKNADFSGPSTLAEAIHRAKQQGASELTKVIRVWFCIMAIEEAYPYPPGRGWKEIAVIDFHVFFPLEQAERKEVRRGKHMINEKQKRRQQREAASGAA